MSVPCALGKVHMTLQAEGGKSAIGMRILSETVCTLVLLECQETNLSAGCILSVNMLG